MSQPESNSLGEAKPGDAARRVSWGERSTWLVDAILVAVAVVGVYYAWPVQAEANKLQAKRAELEARVGVMPIGDPKKYHVMLLPSSTAKELRWRVYLPDRPNHVVRSMSRSSQGGSGGSSSYSSLPESACEGIVIVSFQPSPDGRHGTMKVRTKLGKSNGTSGSSTDEEFTRAIIAGDMSNWRIAGRDGVETFTLDQMVWLLRIDSTVEPMAGYERGMISIGFGTQQASTKEEQP